MTILAQWETLGAGALPPHAQLIGMIEDLAKAGAQASMDAHGRYVPAVDAWIFLGDQWIATCDFPAMHYMPDDMPEEFSAAYARITAPMQLTAWPARARIEMGAYADGKTRTFAC
jgi:hypothetical protein